MKLHAPASVITSDPADVVLHSLEDLCGKLRITRPVGNRGDRDEAGAGRTRIDAERRLKVEGSGREGRVPARYCLAKIGVAPIDAVVALRHRPRQTRKAQ